MKELFKSVSTCPQKRKWPSFDNTVYVTYFDINNYFMTYFYSSISTIVSGCYNRP